MVDARSDSERLPWLDSPRAAKPARAPRRKLPRAPIFALLALFLIATVGVMAYLVGRGSVPVERVDAPATPPSPPAATAIPPQPEPMPTVAEPAPERAVEKARPTPARRPSRPSRAVARAETSPPPDAPSALDATRQAQEAGTSPPPVARTFVPPPAPLVRASPLVQVGTYTSRRRADAAHRRLARDYPYIKSLPRIVRPIRPAGSRRTFYRLQYQARSPDYARILCQNVRAIRRGCMVLPAAR